MAIPMIYGGSPDSVARADQVRAQMINQRTMQGHQLAQQAAAMMVQQGQHHAAMQEQAKQREFQNQFAQEQFQSQELERRARDRQRSIENLQRDRQLDISAAQLSRAERADDLRYQEAARLRAAEAQALRDWRQQEADKDRAADEKKNQEIQDQRLYQTTMARAGNMSSAALMQLADQVQTPSVKTAILGMVDQKLRTERQDYNLAKSWADQANEKIRPLEQALVEAEIAEQQGGEWYDPFGWRPSRNLTKAQKAFNDALKTSLDPDAAYMVRWDGKKFVPNYVDPDAEIDRIMMESQQRQQQQEQQQMAPPMVPPQIPGAGQSSPMGFAPQMITPPDVEESIMPFAPMGTAPQMISAPDVSGGIMPFGPAGVGEQPIPQQAPYTGPMITPEDTSLLQPGRRPVDFTPFVGGEYHRGPGGAVVQFPGAASIPSLPMLEDPALGGGGITFGGQAAPYTAEDQMTVMRVYQSLLEQGEDPDRALAIAFERVNRLKREALMTQ